MPLSYVDLYAAEDSHGQRLSHASVLPILESSQHEQLAEHC